MEAGMTLKEKLKELIRDRLIYASGIKTRDLFDHTAELTVENIISMLEPSQDKVETVAKYLYEQDYSPGYWDTRMSKGDKSKWLVKAREICNLFPHSPDTKGAKE